MKGQTPSRGARPHEGRRAWSRPFVPTLRAPQIECPGVCGDGARFRKAQWADERGDLKHRGGARKLAGVHGGTVRSARGRGKIRLRSRRIAQPCSITVTAAMEQAATGGVACARSAGAVGGRPDRRHPHTQPGSSAPKRRWWGGWIVAIAVVLVFVAFALSRPDRTMPPKVLSPRPHEQPAPASVPLCSAVCTGGRGGCPGRQEATRRDDLCGRPPACARWPVRRHRSSRCGHLPVRLDPASDHSDAGRSFAASTDLASSTGTARSGTSDFRARPTRTSSACYADWLEHGRVD